MMKDINIKAILIGFLVDIGGTFAFSFGFGIIGVLALLSTGRDVKELEAFSSTGVFWLSMSIAGLLFTGLGGYVTGRIAKKAEIKNSLMVGVISALLGVVSIFFSKDSSSLLFELIALVLTVLFALIGGYISLKLKAPSPANQ